MATRVNTRFVVLLTSLIVVACAGVVGAFVFLVYHSGADLARMGDKQMAAKNYKDASELYSRAVNKEKVNSVFIQKWIDSLRMQTPETQPRYTKAYQDLVSAMRQLAMVKSSDMTVQREYLDHNKRWLDLAPANRDALEGFIREAQTLIDQQQGTGAAADPLRRYRGLTRLRVAMEVADAGPEYLDGAKADLEAALAADPDDGEVARGLERYYAFVAFKSEAANKPDEVAAAVAKGGEVVAAYLARQPNDPAMMLVRMRRELDAFTRDVRSRTEKQNLQALSDQFRAMAKPGLDAAAAAAMSLPPAKVDTQLFNALRQAEVSLDPDARQSRSEALLRQVIAARPNDAQLISMLADLLELREEHSAAVAVLQQIVDMPDRPVSLDGVLLFDERPDALLRQGLWTVREWQTLSVTKEGGGDAAKHAAAKAREVRDKLAVLKDESYLGLMLLNAELAFIDGHDREATRLLEQFDRASHGASPDALMVGAQVAMRLKEPGSARQRLRQLLDMQPGNLRAAFILAGIDAQMQNYPEAASLYQQILNALPDNKQAAEGLKLVRAIQEGSGAKIDDPIIKVIIDVDSMLKDNSQADGPAKAATMLREQIEAHGQDPRLVRALANAELRNNNLAGATQAVADGLKAHPESKDLELLSIQLTGGNTLETRLKLIDTLGLLEHQRLSERYVAYKAFRKLEEAKVELAAALKAAPDDPGVLELVFMQALEDKDTAKAQELANRAVKDDLDKAGGATYQARFESSRGRQAEAVRIMEELVKRGGAQPEAWRLLGRLQNTIERRADAVKSFKSALDLRPSDVATIKDLMNTQVVMNQGEDALTTARQYRVWAQGDEEFNNVWLSLEAGFGNRKMVQEERERMARQNPDNRDNLMSLAALYMDTNEPDKARSLIDRVRAKKDGLDSVNLDAGWYWSANQPGKAKSIFETFIGGLDNSAKLQALMVYAQFLGQRQDGAGSLAALDQARAFQTPQVSEADRVIGDTCLAMHREDDAIAAFKRVVDAHSDTADQVYLKRMIESMISKGRFAEADALLKPLLDGTQENSTVMLLSAASRAGQNDPQGQRQLLDRAVSLFPNEALPYVKRAQSLISNDATELSELRTSNPSKYEERARDLRDAADDLTRAIQLQPNLWVAYRLRAAAYGLQGETDKSVADLRSSLLANPGDLDLMRELMRYLLENNKEDQANTIALELVNRRPSDPMIRYNVGNVFDALNRRDKGAQFMGMAFDLDQQDAIAQRYLDDLLATTPPNIAGALDVLEKLTKAGRVNNSPGFLMSQAMVQMKQNAPALAVQSAGQALRLLKPDNTSDMLTWFGGVQQMESDPKRLRVILDNLAAGGVAPEWLTYFRANIALLDPAPQSQKDGENMLAGVLKDSKSPPIRQLSGRRLGELWYGQKRYDEAAVVMRAGASEFPQDVENLNNLAYLLAKNLGKPEEALPMAEQAATLAPRSGEVVDTLGLVQFMTGKIDKSVETLTTALRQAQSPFAAATISIHLADALWAQGKKEEARQAMENAQTIVTKQGTTANAQTKDDLEQLRKKITAP